MSLGFIVGKFYPPHQGHSHLIRTARRQVDELIVLIAAHPSQTIPGELRQEWLKRLHPDCDVRLVPDMLKDDSEQWAKFTLDYLGRAPDFVFTSEDYGPRFAELMGSRHVLVDRERKIIPISGTKIRSSPLANLQYLEPCVRAWYVLRVVILGSESTGKTTLAERLAREFQTEWVPEYGREHWEKKVAGLAMDGPLPSWSAEEFAHIAETQQAREWSLAEKANRVLICDTNSFATGTWYERYFSERSTVVDAIGKKDKVDLYFLARPDVPFIQDGFRDGEKIREWMDRRFEEQLAKIQTPVVSLSGLYEARFETAKSAIQRLVGSVEFEEK